MAQSGFKHSTAALVIRNAIFSSHSFLFLFTGLAFAASGAATGLPDESLNVKLAAPIRTWDEAVPLGNGLLGGLLWGETNLLRLSLDRGDLWDLRTPPETHEPGFTFQNMAKLVREQNQKEISRLFDRLFLPPQPFFSTGSVTNLPRLKQLALT